MPKTLLLADDSVTIQKVVGISFANEDIELLTVDNGDDAIARAREAKPDIVLADVVMPGRNGYEVCEAIKSDPQLAHIPVLLLTGTFEAFDEDRAGHAGADGHVTKPFEAQGLVDRVNGLLAQGVGAGSEPPASPAALPIGLIDLQTGTTEPARPFDLSAEEVTEPGAPSIGNDATMVAERGSAAEAPDSLGFDVPRAAPSAGDALEEALADTHAARQLKDPFPAPGATFTSDAPPEEAVSEPDLGDPLAAPTRFAAGDASGDAEPFGFESEPVTLHEAPVAPPAPEPLETDPLADLGTDDEGATRLFDEFSAEPTGSETRIMGFGDTDGSAPELDPAPLTAPEAAADAILYPDAGGAYDVSSSDLGDPLAASSGRLDSFATSVAEPVAIAEPAEALPPAAPPLAGYDSEPELAALVAPVEDEEVGEVLAAPAPLYEAPSYEEPPRYEAPTLDAATEAQAEPLYSPVEADPSPVASPSLPDGPTPELSSLVREQVQEAIEKIAWEAFSQVTESIVKDAIQKVEKVAWEVVPQLTEALIREEIRKLKEEE